MKRLSAIVAASLVVLASLFGCAQMSGSDAGWTTLVDGTRGLENFDRVGDANWRAEDGAIVADKGKGGFLVSKNSYKDFQVRVEFWAADTANSGIYMRCADRDNITDKSCYEANIFDQRPDQTFATGGIVHHGPVTKPMKAGGKWNTYEITVKGTELVVVLNGVETARATNSLLAQGPLALQYAQPGGAIKFRKVQVKGL